jgi:hypothetical protein
MVSSLLVLQMNTSQNNEHVLLNIFDVANMLVEIKSGTLSNDASM